MFRKAAGLRFIGLERLVMDRTRAEILLMLLGLPLAYGCTSNAAHVQGQVTMDGHPTQDGYVTFRRIDKDQPAFVISYRIERGQYSSKAAGTPLSFGNYEVRVAITKKTGRRIPLPGAPDGQMQDEIIVISSADHNGPKSPLKYEHKTTGLYDIDVPGKKS